jgi:tetratricopeptide (TPR) repeat protein
MRARRAQMMRTGKTQGPWAAALRAASLLVVAVLVAQGLWAWPALCDEGAAEAHRDAGEQMGPQKPEEPAPPPEANPPAAPEQPGPQKPAEPEKAEPAAPEAPAEPAPAAPEPPKPEATEPPTSAAPEAPAPKSEEEPGPPTVVQPKELTPQEARRVKSLLDRADKDFKSWRMLEAEGAYRAVLDIDPTNVHARRRLGDCLMNQDRFAEAKAAYGALEALPAEQPEDLGFKGDPAALVSLAAESAERLCKKPDPAPLTDLDKRAFRDQAVRVSEMLRDENDYGGALRTVGYAEWLGRDVGAPLTGEKYNELLTDAARYQMDNKNYAALAGLFDLADFLSIHSRQRADLEGEYEALVRGEGQRIEAASRPFLAALDEEVQKRKVEDAQKAKSHRPSRIAQIMGTFAGLAGELVGIRAAGPLIGAIPMGTSVATAEVGPAGKYTHRCSRRVDYGKIVKLNESDRAAYTVAPFAFTMTPGEWQAYAGARGYPPHQAELPGSVTDGPFIVAREPAGAGGVFGYYHHTDASDPKAQVLGRYSNPLDAEKALEYFIGLDPAAYTGTISHD